ncbi:inositol monophosphatase family protein [Corynebacterium halotolerans]|uniref:Myo-inositol-1(Or 4)-monophosphatase n=1 Tax=Corynebacterium halotolerans YIM 70093 = DSM 44683 TaxID=1121362 RepID=M1NZ93_9CORY|nr:inositol monophosphatase [Corynebacterium halotolerans]AGF72835.1 myo-inositol-1(or 4)-monophosphatase [Corynebacterium halotolerans YIM 70093 = DSM 44683]
MSDARELLAIAEAIVDDAERMFLAGVGADPSQLKQPGDFTTDVDLAIEDHLRRTLTRMTGLPVYGEESGGTLDHRAVWVVDPVDGTSNYAAGNPMCAILVSLLVDNQPVAAVTSMPMLHRRLTAFEGSPLLVNGRAASPLTESSPLIAQVGFSSVASPLDSPISSIVRQGLLSDLAETFLRPRITGSVGVDLAFAAQGIFGGAVSFSPYVWDNAAGVMLVRAAGGVVTDIEGKAWTPGATGVIAGTRAAHEEIMSTMNRILNS